MALPQDKFVAVSSVVKKPDFKTEKPHIIFATCNSLFGADTPFIEIESEAEYKKLFGIMGGEAEYKALQNYFAFTDKGGISPEKAVLIRWYKNGAPAFVMGEKCETQIEVLQTINSGSLQLKLDGVDFKIDGVKFDTAESFTSAAELLQAKINTIEALKKVKVAFNPELQTFIITGGEIGKSHTIEILRAEKNDIAEMLGLTGGKSSEGTDAETFAQFTERVFNINPVGFAITTCAEISDEDKKEAIKVLNTTRDGTSFNSKYKLIFNFTNKKAALKFAESLKDSGYTGYTITFDPLAEGVNILSAAIGACVDFETEGAAINFNFQKVRGFTPITNNNKVGNYQAGITDLDLTRELDKHKINYVYSVGVGSAYSICYGLGLMAGSFATEDVQLNENWLTKEIKTVVMNALLSLPKIALRGRGAVATLESLLVPVFTRAVKNGAVANGGTLSDSDKITLKNTMGEDVANTIEQLGYYWRVENLNPTDIEKRRVRIGVAYLTPGAINFVRVINNIYGA